ncbi:MAG: hypothetical protein AAGA96_08775 [Verrucomicrobiota bacterium]
MKKKSWVVILILFFFGGQAILEGQIVPPNPNQFTKRNLGEGGSSISGGTVSGSVRQTQTVQYISVTPLRDWTNLDGKTIQARLLAFSAPEPGKTGPVEVIRQGKVRLLLSGGKAPVDYPLENLEEADRSEIERIAKLAALGPPAAANDSDEKKSE